MADARQPHILDAVFHAAGDGQVVDVFGRACEMYQSLQAGQLGVVAKHVGALSSWSSM